MWQSSSCARKWAVTCCHPEEKKLLRKSMKMEQSFHFTTSIKLNGENVFANESTKHGAIHCHPFGYWCCCYWWWGCWASVCINMFSEYFGRTALCMKIPSDCTQVIINNNPFWRKCRHFHDRINWKTLWNLTNPCTFTPFPLHLLRAKDTQSVKRELKLHKRPWDAGNRSTNLIPQSVFVAFIDGQSENRF